jgi:hypothetical protein
VAAASADDSTSKPVIADIAPTIMQIVASVCFTLRPMIQIILWDFDPASSIKWSDFAGLLIFHFANCITLGIKFMESEFSNQTVASMFFTIATSLLVSASFLTTHDSAVLKTHARVFKGNLPSNWSWYQLQPTLELVSTASCDWKFAESQHVLIIFFCVV